MAHQVSGDLGCVCRSPASVGAAGQDLPLRPPAVASTGLARLEPAPRGAHVGKGEHGTLLGVAFTGAMTKRTEEPPVFCGPWAGAVFSGGDRAMVSHPGPWGGRVWELAELDPNPPSPCHETPLLPEPRFPSPRKGEKLSVAEQA